MGNLQSSFHLSKHGDWCGCTQENVYTLALVPSFPGVPITRLCKGKMRNSVELSDKDLAYRLSFQVM